MLSGGQKTSPKLLLKNSLHPNGQKLLKQTELQKHNRETGLQHEKSNKTAVHKRGGSVRQPGCADWSEGVAM